MHSLSRTLVVGTTLLTAAVLATAGVILYLLARMSLLAELDRSLADRAELLASTIEIEDGKLDLELVDLDLRTFEGRRPDVYVQVRSADGAILYKSPSLAGADLAAERIPGGNSGHFDTELPDGRLGRAVRLAFFPRNEMLERQGEGPVPSPQAAGLPDAGKEGGLSMVLAQSTSRVDAVLDRLRLLLVLVGGIAAAVASGALWFYVAQSLRPLKKLAQQIGQLGEKDLKEPIAATAYPSEIAPVVDRLNQLLERLDTAFCRERTMNANVAHELRNPLAGLRLKLDVAVSRNRDARQYRQALDECRVIASQLQQIVENLLSLARLDAGQFDLRPEPVRFEELIRSHWSPLAELAEQRRLNLHWDLEPGLTAVTDAALLGIAVRNLLDNAVTYADEGGSISVHMRTLDHQMQLSVINSGSRLNQEDSENALAPFWQHDPSRSATGVHCGLGLALVQRIVTVLQGRLSLNSSPGGAFEIGISLPASRAPPSTGSA